MTTTLFNQEDLAELERRGIAPEVAAEQIALLRNPPPAIVLDRPATVGDGLVRLEALEQSALMDRGDAATADGRVTKFVPASGAATRMFKDLISALDNPRRPSASPAPRELFERLDELPFAEELRNRSGITGPPASAEEERRLLRVLLEDMQYAQKPKGLIPFHRTSKVRTAFEEHLIEGTGYTRARDGACRMHFTVAPEFRGEFQRVTQELAPEIETPRRELSLQVTFSEQHPSTDTLAIDDRGEPFRSADGRLVFRPGGHGSLLHNLAAVGGDVITLKNIDNVVPAELSGEVVRWKRILIGFLARLQTETFELLAACDAADVTDAMLERAIAFAAYRFARTPAEVLATRDAKRRYVRDALDRPMRVCGMVRNEGEPGGAPFWVTAPDGTRSLQIVESSQVDTSSPAQLRIFRSATHFNPVDIVCGVRNWKGELFELERFVDPSTVFLSRKSHEGRDLVALERPGLWNGAMAHWNTLCVEVPAATFAPVKTVFDLLRPQHQYHGSRVDMVAALEPAGRSLARAGRELAEKEALLVEQLRAASDIQRSLLPHGETTFGRFRAAAVFHPSMEVGGDVYGFVPLGPGRGAAWIADVSGRGVVSVLLAMSVAQRLAAPSGVLLGSATPSPAAVLADLEREYPFERFGKYFSIALAIFDLEAQRLTCSSAGHPDPMLVRADGSIERLDAGAPVIGMGFGAEFEEATRPFSRGDRLVLYTDGVTEDESNEGEPFGIERLERLFREGREESLGALAYSVLDTLSARRGDAPPADDIALIALEWR